MGDTKFTFVELHLDGDTRFSPMGIVDLLKGGDAESEPAALEATAEATEDADEDDSGGPGALGVVVGLVALVGIALAVRRFRGGDEEQTELEEYEEPDVVVD